MTSCSGGLRLNPFLSCFVGQSLAPHTFEGDFGAIRITIAKLDAGVLAEVEFGQVTVKMLGVDMLINPNNAALENREKPFKRIGMYVAARPFKLVVIDGFVSREATEFEVLAHVGNEAAILAHHRPQMPSDAMVIEADRPDVAATLNEAQDLGIVSTAAEAFRAPRLARPGHFGFVRLNRLAFAAQRANRTIRGHCRANTVAKEPRGFHAAIQHPLNLPRGDAFLGTAKQVDDLKPQMQGKVAVLKKRAHADCEGLFAGVALVQARTGRLAIQAANAGRFPAMRTNRAIRPKPCLDIRKGGRFVEELRGVQDGLSHGNLQ